MAYLNANIPPIGCYVRSNFLQNRPEWDEEKDSYFPVLIFGVASMPHRVPLFHFVMEDEGVWFRMPIHAFCHKTPAKQPELTNLVLWDCFSYHVSVTQYDFFINKRMRYIDRNKNWQDGTYLFTLDWAQEDKNVVDLGFSEFPGEHKCGHFIKLDDGNFAIQPNNRIRAFDPSFVTKPGQNVIERKIGTHMWSVENTSKWVLSDDDRYEYTIEENTNGNNTK
jgi:hypothetical protein